MEKTTWKHADPALRAELEAILAKPNDAFESDFQDALVWWLVLLIGSVVAVTACIWAAATDSSDYGFVELVKYFPEDPINTLNGLVVTPRYVGLPVALIVGAWAAITIARNVGRRGVALTSDALVLLRGPKLYVVRFSDVQTATKNTVRTKKQTFDVITLKLKNGKTQSIYAHGRFTGLAMPKLTS